MTTHNYAWHTDRVTPEQWRQRVGRHVEHHRGREAVRAIAKRAGVSEGLWRQVESGRRVLAKGVVRTVSPKPETAAMISRALGWTETGIDDLLEGRGPTLVTRDGDYALFRPPARPITPSTNQLGQDVEALRGQVAELAAQVTDSPVPAG